MLLTGFTTSGVVGSVTITGVGIVIAAAAGKRTGFAGGTVGVRAVRSITVLSFLVFGLLPDMVV